MFRVFPRLKRGFDFGFTFHITYCIILYAITYYSYISISILYYLLV